jgi:hypothetical protein
MPQAAYRRARDAHIGPVGRQRIRLQHSNDANNEAVLAELAEAGLTVEATHAEDSNESWDGLGMFSEDSTRLLSALSEPFDLDTYAFGDGKGDELDRPRAENAYRAFALERGWIESHKYYGALSYVRGKAGSERILMLGSDLWNGYDVSTFGEPPGRIDILIEASYPDLGASDRANQSRRIMLRAALATFTPGLVLVIGKLIRNQRSRSAPA